MSLRFRLLTEAGEVGWLARLLTHPVRGLENYRELFENLTAVKGAIKVYCEVAGLGPE